MSDITQYDTDMLGNFLEAVFHTELAPDENILCWANAGTPKFPIAEDELYKRLENKPVEKPLYFGTSTCGIDPESQKLRNRKNLFQRLHVLVLDDIGTKVPLEKLEKIQPTYIIESSAGNYQYGYVLEGPIASLALANALVQLVYGAGFSDEGGKMATKLVRLPDGINGKKGAKGQFHVELKSLKPDRRWTPQALLEAMEIPTTWKELQLDAEGAVARANPAVVGSTPWSPIKADHAALSGVVDPMLEWVYAEGLVKQDAGDWVTIECPWAHEHTSGEDTAGYKPLGRGATPNSRGFHCFHEACSSRHTLEFLADAAAKGSPEVATVDPAAALVTRFIFDSSSNGVWDLHSAGCGRFIDINAFGNTYPIKRTVMTADGKAVRISEAILWRNAPNRVTVVGSLSDPSTTARIVRRDGELHFNTFTRPNYGSGVYLDSDIERFQQYLRYLIPENKSYEYFMDWVAAKIQNPMFRGTAVVMVTETQGVGRSTLGDMLATLLGEWNRANVKFDNLVGDNSNFNEWVERLLVVTDETKSVSPNSPTFSKAYEALKDIVDPRSKITEINPKYGKKRTVVAHASFLMFSNHSAALCTSKEDRRLYVIDNPVERQTPEFFMEHNAWLRELDADGLPRWARSVHRWLMSLTPDIKLLTSPPAMTEAKKKMLAASRSGADLLVEATIQAVDCRFVRVQDLVEYAMTFLHRVGDYNEDKSKLLLRRLFKGRVANLNTRNQCKHSGTNTTRATSIVKSLASRDDMTRYVIDAPDRTDLDEAFGQIREYKDNSVSICAKISTILSAADY